MSAASAPSAPTTYGVWIAGWGWLRGGDSKTFASLDRAVAESAAALWGTGAQVHPIDDSLIDLQDVFLEQQAKQVSTKAWWEWLTTKR